MVDDTQKFLQLNMEEEEERRRSSNSSIQIPSQYNNHPGYGSGTVIHLGCGSCCPNVKVKAEMEEGNLRIGRVVLATNCHLIVLTFGFFFLLAGGVLTTLAYSKRPRSSELESSEGSRDEEKIAGPTFLVLGACLLVFGLFLGFIGEKVKREVKRGFVAPYAGPSELGSFAEGSNSSRVDSIFTAAYFRDRRKTLPTISQAVPVGFLMDGRFSGIADSASISASFDRSPMSRKASLSLRPSLPIPVIASPIFLRNRGVGPLDPNSLLMTRSDEPFGSIVSLTGTGDIASFPEQHRSADFVLHVPPQPSTSAEMRRARSRKAEMPTIQIDHFVNPLSKEKDQEVEEPSEEENHFPTLQIQTQEIQEKSTDC